MSQPKDAMPKDAMCVSYLRFYTHAMTQLVKLPKKFLPELDFHSDFHPKHPEGTDCTATPW